MMNAEGVLTTMEFQITSYDEYQDVPLRGILTADGQGFAFEARPLEADPPEIADLPGVYSEVRVFACSADLRPVMQEQHDIFQTWRSQFDKGIVLARTHPLYTNSRYQLLMQRIDRMFASVGEPVFQANGLMRVASGRFVFCTVP